MSTNEAREADPSSLEPDPSTAPNEKKVVLIVLGVLAGFVLLIVLNMK